MSCRAGPSIASFARWSNARGSRAIGVVLSGVDSDGAANRPTAQFSGMPVAAQASAQHSLSPAQIGDLLMAHFGLAPLPQADAVSASG